MCRRGQVQRMTHHPVLPDQPWLNSLPAICLRRSRHQGRTHKGRTHGSSEVKSVYLTSGLRGRAMGDVRKKGTGTWDITQNRWELKKLGIRMTPKQLADALGEPVPEGKIASRHFWDKYLAAFQRADTAKKRQRSHL